MAPTHPGEMTSEEILQEIAALLARGFLRHKREMGSRGWEQPPESES